MRPLLLGLGIALVCGAPVVRAAEPAEWLAEGNRLGELVELYKHFHTHPELSLKEQETGLRLAAELKAAGFEVQTEQGGYGVVGVLKNGPGKTVLIRTDLDALPVTEETGLPYASKVRTEDDDGQEVGVMHACGHDIHITNVVGVARYLAQNKHAWSGTVVAIGQPAEEKGNGAVLMLTAGLFKKFPKPDYALAIHTDATHAVGQIRYRPGYALANVDSIDITVRGRGGHGAYPHTTVDPVVQAAHLIVDLQSIVSREIAPIEPAVITVGSIHGGTKHNIIGNSCHLQLTVRSYGDKTRAQLMEAITRKAKAAALSANAPEPVIKVTEGTPSMFNNEQLVDRLVPVFRKLLAEENVLLADPSMGGEDFSEYGRAGVPIFMWSIGAVPAARLAGYAERGETPPSLHSSKFAPDPEGTLRVAFRTLTAGVLELLPPAK